MEREDYGTSGESRGAVREITFSKRGHRYIAAKEDSDLDWFDAVVLSCQMDRRIREELSNE